MRFWLAILLIIGTCGCGRFAARRIAQAPNSYPTWLAPEAPVTVTFHPRLLTNFTSEYLHVSSPPARIRYRIIEAGDYQFRWTNRVDEASGKLDFEFTFDLTDGGTAEQSAVANVPARGTVILLHGYGVAGFAMFHWALLLAEQGWRCVLVDLRGHGGSSSKWVYFGTQELEDLRALLTQIQKEYDVEAPVAVVGHSFGGVLALRWKLSDPRIGRVVSMSPYADLGAAVQNIRRQYARWVPKSFIAAGLRELPRLLNVQPGELHPACWVNNDLSDVLFVAGSADAIATLDQVKALHQLAGAGNKMLILHDAGHETLPFYLEHLAEPVSHWLKQTVPKDPSTELHGDENGT